jgi:hypothetical protein
LTREEITDQLSRQKQAWKKSAKQRKRLSDNLKEKERSDVIREEDEDDDDDDDGRSRVKRDEQFADVFDRDGKVVKVPVYEEYEFPCKKWFATDEADGLIERELDVDKQTLFFQER